jgi:nucleotide-binding universal stress UspA family protein
MPLNLDTLLKRLEGFLHAEKDWVQCKPNDAARAHREAERNEALGKLGDELEAYRAGLASGRIFRRLLVAVDNTGLAGWAIKSAVQLANELGGKIGLVHITPGDIGFTPEFAYAESSVLLEQRREGQEILKRAEASVPKSLRAGSILKEGDPMQQIVAAAKEWKADLIVIGTHGRGPVAHFLLGSTAEAVVRHAHCPVLMIGHDPSQPSPKACVCASGKCCEASKAAQLAKARDATVPSGI